MMTLVQAGIRHEVAARPQESRRRRYLGGSAGGTGSLTVRIVVFARHAWTRFVWALHETRRREASLLLAQHRELIADADRSGPDEH
jgi:hypothetical protein